jgi:hypothetical protein
VIYSKSMAWGLVIGCAQQPRLEKKEEEEQDDDEEKEEEDRRRTRSARRRRRRRRGSNARESYATDPPCVPVCLLCGAGMPRGRVLWSLPSRC